MNPRSPLLALILLVLASIQPGCGAEPAPRAPSATPQSAPKTASESPDARFAQPPPPPPGTSTALPTLPGATAQPPATAGMPTTVPGQAMMMALLDLEQESVRLEAPVSSCDLACRALGSLERAARVVCDLDQETEHPRCEMARTRLRTARARVRASCGQCAGGPTTDPEAPMKP